MLCVFCNGDSEESLHLVWRDYPTLENQLEIQSRLKKQVFEETVEYIQHEVFNLTFIFEEVFQKMVEIVSEYDYYRRRVYGKSWQKNLVAHCDLLS